MEWRQGIQTWILRIDRIKGKSRKWESGKVGLRLRAVVEDGFVDGFEALDHGAEVEVLLGVEFSLGGEVFSFFGVSKELEDGGEEGIVVAWGGEEAGLVVDAHLGNATDGVADDGAVAEQGLNECAGLAFLIGGQRMDVHGA